MFSRVDKPKIQSQIKPEFGFVTATLAVDEKPPRIGWTQVLSDVAFNKIRRYGPTRLSELAAQTINLMFGKMSTDIFNLQRQPIRKLINAGLSVTHIDT